MIFHRSPSHFIKVSLKKHLEHWCRIIRHPQILWEQNWHSSRCLIFVLLSFFSIVNKHQPLSTSFYAQISVSSFFDQFSFFPVFACPVYEGPKCLSAQIFIPFDHISAVDFLFKKFPSTPEVFSDFFARFILSSVLNIHRFPFSLYSLEIAGVVVSWKKAMYTNTERIFVRPRCQV